MDDSVYTKLLEQRRSDAVQHELHLLKYGLIIGIDEVQPSIDVTDGAVIEMFRGGAGYLDV